MIDPATDGTIIGIYRGPAFVGVAMNDECLRVLDGRPMLGIPFAEVFDEPWVQPGIAMMRRVWRHGGSETIEMPNIIGTAGVFTAHHLPAAPLARAGLAIVWTPLGVPAGSPTAGPGGCARAPVARDAARAW